MRAYWKVIRRTISPGIGGLVAIVAAVLMLGFGLSMFTKILLFEDIGDAFTTLGLCLPCSVGPILVFGAIITRGRFASAAMVGLGAICFLTGGVCGTLGVAYDKGWDASWGCIILCFPPGAVLVVACLLLMFWAVASFDSQVTNLHHKRLSALLKEGHGSLDLALAATDLAIGKDQVLQLLRSPHWKRKRGLLEPKDGWYYRRSWLREHGDRLIGMTETSGRLSVQALSVALQTEEVSIGHLVRWLATQKTYEGTFDPSGNYVLSSKAKHLTRTSCGSCGGIIEAIGFDLAHCTHCGAEARF
jgi:hypothetical protein